MSPPIRLIRGAHGPNLYACLRGLYDLAGSTGERRLAVHSACRGCGHGPIVIEVKFAVNRRGQPVAHALEPAPGKCAACGETLTERTLTLLCDGAVEASESHPGGQSYQEAASGSLGRLTPPATWPPSTAGRTAATPDQATVPLFALRPVYPDRSVL